MKTLFNTPLFLQEQWAAIFQAPQLNLEIGCGYGHFLLYMAQQYPNQTFLGIDIINKLLHKIENHIHKRQLTNVRVAKIDAVLLLRELIADGSLANIYINFPDPWPRDSHQERRIMRHSVLTLMLQKLRFNGTIHFVTDDPDYAAAATKLLQQSSQLEQIEPPILPIMTKYEKKWLAQQKDIFRLSFKKTQESVIQAIDYVFGDEVSATGWPMAQIRQYYQDFRPFLFKEKQIYLKFREAYLSSAQQRLLLKITLAEPDVLAHTFFVEINSSGMVIPKTGYLARRQSRGDIMAMLNRALAQPL